MLLALDPGRNGGEFYSMKAGHKFLLGAAIIVSSVGFLITEGVKETGVYFLTPAELASKTATDPSFVENVGFKVGARVVPGSVRRDPGAQVIDFKVSDGSRPIRSLTTAWCRIPLPMPTTSRSWSKAAWAGMGSSAPPTCSPSAAPATRLYPRPDIP